MFNLSGEAQAKSVPLSNENRTFGIALNIYYKNDSVPETHYKEFNSNIDQKQTVCLSIVPKNNNKEIDYVAFAFVYGYDENTMTVHNAMLNISSTRYTSDTTTETAETSTEGGTTSDTTEETEVDNFIDYEVISETVDKSQAFMQTSTGYDTTGNYATTQTDEAGNTVTYTYDVNGNVTSTTDGEENVVNYTYYSDGNVSQVSSYGAQNTYYYNVSGSISNIKHNGFVYTFNYNEFNKLLSTKIGSTEIVKNTYSTSTGNLRRTVFANGDRFTYDYDSYDNIIKIVDENGKTDEFKYNKKGLLAKMINNSAGEITYYYYDFSGNLIGEYRQLSNGELSYYLSYDKDGNRVENTMVNGQIKTITRGSDENSTYVNNDGITVSALSDNFGRTTRVVTSRGEDQAVYFSSYEYANGNATNSTTNLVSKLTQTYANNELIEYEYTYDGNGNIYDIRQNGTIVARYSYDDLNQLIWSADTNTGLYTSYTYDNAGNITSVKEYTLNAASWLPSTLQSEKTYVYGDTEWKDKLTSYNGTTITYDAMGNPLTYRDGMSFEWKNGRRLSKITKGSTAVDMAYDTNGMRLYKYDGNYLTNYYYDSKNNLIGLDKAGSTLFFYYDNNGTPTAFKNNGIMYYYVKNLQGDVIKILKQDGTVAATYTYDAWGKILSVKDGSNVNVPSSNGFHVANLNPYRYRGYLYDTETGLYYLQTRYYDPVVGRFLNADDMQFIIQYSVLSANLYTYCRNNSITNIDIRGTSPDYYMIPRVNPVPTEALGEGFKTLVAMAASVYLDSKGYTISKKLFLHSLYGSGNGLAPEVIEEIIDYLQADKAFMDAAKEAVNNKNGYGWVKDQRDDDSTYEFDEEDQGDLFYCIQHANITANKVFYYDHKDGAREGIRIFFRDRYDFDGSRLLSEGFGFANAANDLGLVMQILNLLKPYEVEISFTYYYGTEEG